VDLARMQDGAQLGVQALGAVRDALHPVETVDHALVLAIGDGNAGVAQPGGVGAPVVAQRVELRGGDEGGREARVVARPQRRDAPVAGDRLVGDAMVPEPMHRLALEQVALGVLVRRCGVPAVIDGWVDQALKGDPRPALVAGP
jgi:hypothetical protein